MRHVAKNMVAAGIAHEILVQVAYAIGVARPVGLFVNTFGTSNVQFNDSEIAQKILDIFDLRPGAIINRFGLKNPIYLPTAAYGHMGRDYHKDLVEIITDSNSTLEKRIQKEVEFFAWEKTDYADVLRSEFGLSQQISP
jgi:S-adenosylmethionine synthetase